MKKIDVKVILSILVGLVVGALTLFLPSNLGFVLTLLGLAIIYLILNSSKIVKKIKEH